MRSPLSTVHFEEALERERFAAPARRVVLPDLNLSALEQQFFVDWEVPQAHDSRDGAVSAS